MAQAIRWFSNYATTDDRTPYKTPQEAIAACLNLGLDLWLDRWHPSLLLLISLTPLDAHPLRSPHNPIFQCYAFLVSQPKPDLQFSLNLEHLISCQSAEHSNHFDSRYRDHVLDVECTGLQES